MIVEILVALALVGAVGAFIDSILEWGKKKALEMANKEKGEALVEIINDFQKTFKKVEAYIARYGQVFKQTKTERIPENEIPAEIRKKLESRGFVKVGQLSF